VRFVSAAIFTPFVKNNIRASDKACVSAYYFPISPFHFMSPWSSLFFRGEEEIIRIALQEIFAIIWIDLFET